MADWIEFGPRVNGLFWLRCLRPVYELTDIDPQGRPVGEFSHMEPAITLAVVEWYAGDPDYYEVHPIAPETGGYEDDWQITHACPYYPPPFPDME